MLDRSRRSGSAPRASIVMPKLDDAHLPMEGFTSNFFFHNSLPSSESTPYSVSPELQNTMSLKPCPLISREASSGSLNEVPPFEP
jgi:hypothetical protein